MPLLNYCFSEFTQKSDLKIGCILLRKMAFVSESPTLQTLSIGSYVYFWKKVHLHKMFVFSKTIWTVYLSASVTFSLFCRLTRGWKSLSAEAENQEKNSHWEPV